MRKLGLLLSLIIVLVLAMVSPAAAAAADHSGNGMNRQGGPGTHPGNGWKDPGQDQGSPKNTADPDCTGNRASAPQRTNIGACDTPTGAADKPGGRGGFNADRDWNNGCGNDTDFEDDNNGQCHGQHTVKVHPSVTPPAPPAPCDTPKTPHAPPPTTKPPTKPPKDTGTPEKPPTTPPGPHGPPGGGGSPNQPGTTVTPPRTPPPTSTTGPPIVTVMRPVAGPPADVPTATRVPPAPRPAPEIATPLPFTGSRHAVDLTALGLCLVAIGSALVRVERRRA
ncbi:MAG: hypothetical protein V7636_2439 [Actinomycetota bacterium]|jgi:hypothetical protein